VDNLLAIEVQPLDDRKRKGDIVKVYANDQAKITCGEYRNCEHAVPLALCTHHNLSNHLFCRSSNKGTHKENP
uniref:Uncharacterized protein n=1 Tax=Aegilops tauschii subsp. strangulata TaxID=200361 RepID=A0A453DMY3_AEGTS